MNPAIEALFIEPTLMVALLIFANFSKVNLKATKWLSAFIFLIFTIQLEVLFDNIHIFGKNTAVNDVFNLANYIIAPVFYFGIIYYAEPNRKWKKKG